MHQCDPIVPCDPHSRFPALFGGRTGDAGDVVQVTRAWRIRRARDTFSGLLTRPALGAAGDVPGAG